MSPGWAAKPASARTSALCSGRSSSASAPSLPSATSSLSPGSSPRPPSTRQRARGSERREPLRLHRRRREPGHQRPAAPLPRLAPRRRWPRWWWLARCAPAPSLDVRDIRLPPRLAMSQRRALGMKAEPTGPRPGRSPHPCGALGFPVVANQCRGAGAERHRGTVESGARPGGRRRSSISAPARSGGRHRLQRNRGSGDGEHH